MTGEFVHARRKNRTRPFFAVVLVLTLLHLPAFAQQDLWQLYNSGNLQVALERGSALLKDSPDDRDLHHLVGRALSDLGRNAEARPHLEFCLEGDTRDWRYSWSLFYLGGIAAAEGRLDEARNAWLEVRDAQITQNVARSAAANLCSFGLSEDFDEWTHKTSDHLDVVFSPAHSAKDAEKWMRVHDVAWSELSELFGGSPAYRIRYIVWADIPEATRICGIKSLGFATPQYNLVHCAFGQTRGHEMAHVFCGQLLKPKTANRFFNEGFAVAHDLTHRDRMASARAAMTRAGVSAIHIAALWSGTQEGGAEILYPVGGAWVDFLIDRAGREKLFEFARDQRLEAAQQIYGADWPKLVSDFEGLLNAPSD